MKSQSPFRLRFSKKVKNPPGYIIYKRICEYLNQQERIDLDKKLDKAKLPYGRQYFNIISENFDIEKFRTEPLNWKDI